MIFILDSETDRPKKFNHLHTVQRQLLQPLIEQEMQIHQK